MPCRILPCRILPWCGGAAAWIVTALCWTCATEADEPAASVDFNREIRPILSKSCYNCHGPDAGHRKAGLRLDLRDGALQELDTGSRAVVPGKADASELYLRVTSDNPAERMPPKGTGHELTAEQIATLARWIKEGAPYAAHWSFVKPQRPALPAVAEAAWPRNPIDAFILSRLEKENLRHAPEADRYALIRRLSLDLRGLPPTPPEVLEFVNDKDPEAYEKLVDRFLSDSAYGERWARVWLDLARYADSKGLGSDPLRTIWRYRDWVIDAFNRNLPFDQFTIEQLAGDLLPEPTIEQRIATAFHRNTMTNTEGGTDDEEFRVAAVKDRVDTTGQVWMGLTVGCAKCHDHKFDPLTQEEYYRFYAFFNQTADNDQPDESPTLAAPTPEIESQLREINEKIAQVQQQLDTPTHELATAQFEWEQTLLTKPQWTVLEPEELKSAEGATLTRQADGSILVEGLRPDHDTYTIAVRTPLNKVTAFRLEALPDPSLPAGGSGRAADGNFVLSRFSVAAENAVEPLAPVRGRFVRIELPGDNKILSLAEVQVFLGADNLARAGKATQSSVEYGGPAELAIDGNTDGNFFAARSTTHTKAEQDPWWEVDLGELKSIDRLHLWNRSDGAVGSRLSGFRLQILDAARTPVWQQTVADPPAPGSEFSTTGKQPVPLAQAAADYSQPSFPVANALRQPDLGKSGWAVGPQVAQPHSAYFIASVATPEFAATRLTVRLEHRFSSPQYSLGRFRLSATTSGDVMKRLAVPAEVLAIVDVPRTERSEPQAAQLAAHYRTLAPLLQPLRDQKAQLEKSRPAIPTVPVMVELPVDKRRVTSIMVKGNFLTPGDPVEARLPVAFHPLPPQASADRLGIAEWIVSRDNPLTARVMVNRFWSQLFGGGLVETEEDFGTQGELPSHPELLDWLALEFIEPSPSQNPVAAAAPLRDARPWDMKRLLKLIVTSATYRQSAQVMPEALARDPRNRLLTRGPRFRLEAEMVRDQALALSGLLSRKMHGPSVYPPQPPGLWQAAFNGERTWTTSEGEDKYRRGLYVLWRRTVPYPSMATFDAPSRELCTVRRVRTNTPLQAFVTLNDPVYVEAAQALARRIVREGGTGVADRARFGLQLCLVRPPGDAQVAELLKLYESELADYRQNEQAALELATDPLGPLPEGMNAPELAAWTVVANVLLNLDGVMMK